MHLNILPPFAEHPIVDATKTLRYNEMRNAKLKMQPERNYLYDDI